MAEEFKVIDTQEAFDAAIKARLERNTRTVTDEVTKKYEGWISPEDAVKNSESLNNEIAGLKKTIGENETTIADLNAKNKAYEIKSAKMKIAYEVGIPFALAEKLSGETEEEIRADAQTLAQYTAGNHQPPPRYSSEPNGKSTNDAALLSMLQEMKK